jgi:predicted nucleic acid-binding protein
VTGWVIDKSALVRLDTSPDFDLWGSRIERGLMRITSLTLLEIGYSARSAADLRLRTERPPVALMPVEYLTPPVEDRAVDVQGLLAERGHHRAPSVPDLLLAAVAELADLTLLHVDKDFELIAEVTGQPMELLRVT